VVAVEGAGEPVPTVEDEGADEGRRPIAALLQDRSDGLEAGGKLEVPVVPDAVLEGVEPGEDRGVGGEGDRGVGEGALEAHSLGGEAVESGGLGAAVPVAPQPAGPRRVEGDEEDVEAGARRRRAPTRPARPDG